MHIYISCKYTYVSKRQKKSWNLLHLCPFMLPPPPMRKCQISMRRLRTRLIDGRYSSRLEQALYIQKHCIACCSTSCSVYIGLAIGHCGFIVVYGSYVSRLDVVKPVLTRSYIHV